MKNFIVVLVVLALGYLGYGFMNASSKEAYLAYQAFATPRVKDDLVYENLAMNSNFRVEGVSYTLESKEKDGDGEIRFVIYQKAGIVYTANPGLIQFRMRHYVTMRPEEDGWGVESLEIELLDNRGQYLPGTEIREVL